MKQMVTLGVFLIPQNSEGVEMAVVNVVNATSNFYHDRIFTFLQRYDIYIIMLGDYVEKTLILQWNE
jgi:hypothetical protein